MSTNPPAYRPKPGAAEFYGATRDFRSQHTALYDFVHPMTAAVWNLRWQVRGYTIERPEVTEAELWARFVQGTGIEYWRNLRRVFLQSTWEAHEAEIAKFVLLGMTALFEGWAEELVGVFPGNRASRRDRIKGLQFPKGWVGPNPRSGAYPAPGAKSVVATLAGSRDPDMGGFRGILQRRRKANAVSEKYSLAELDALLSVFRYFKEVRNAISHQNGRATSELVYAQQQAAALTATDLRLSRIPSMPAVAVGAPVSVSPKATLEYSEVVLRIVLTVDAELSDATGAARAELFRLWRDQWGAKPPRLHPNSARWPRQVEQWLIRARLPVPQPIEPVIRLLRSEGLVRMPTEAKVRDLAKRLGATGRPSAPWSR